MGGRALLVASMPVESLDFAGCYRQERQNERGHLGDLANEDNDLSSTRGFATGFGSIIRTVQVLS